LKEREELEVKGCISDSPPLLPLHFVQPRFLFSLLSAEGRERGRNPSRLNQTLVFIFLYYPCSPTLLCLEIEKKKEDGRQTKKGSLLTSSESLFDYQCCSSILAVFGTKEKEKEEKVSHSDRETEAEK
jgi:hypothetical protein